MRLCSPQKDSVTTLATEQKTIDVDYYMYGWGGEWDKLTEDYSKMTFGWDESTAWKISGDDGYCWWGSGTGWSNTACTYYWNPSSGTVVNMYSQGDFHWLFDAYKHSLYTFLSGSKTGSASCSYWYSGSIVCETKGSCTL